jgi:hypothetical protein
VKTFALDLKDPAPSGRTEVFDERTMDEETARYFTGEIAFVTGVRAAFAFKLLDHGGERMDLDLELMSMTISKKSSESHGSKFFQTSSQRAGCETQANRSRSLAAWS